MRKCCATPKWKPLPADPGLAWPHGDRHRQPLAHWDGIQAQVVPACLRASMSWCKSSRLKIFQHMQPRQLRPAPQGWGPLAEGLQSLLILRPPSKSGCSGNSLLRAVKRDSPSLSGGHDRGCALNPGQTDDRPALEVIPPSGGFGGSLAAREPEAAAPNFRSGRESRQQRISGIQLFRISTGNPVVPGRWWRPTRPGAWVATSDGAPRPQELRMKSSTLHGQQQAANTATGAIPERTAASRTNEIDWGILSFQLQETNSWRSVRINSGHRDRVSEDPSGHVHSPTGAAAAGGHVESCR